MNAPLTRHEVCEMNLKRARLAQLPISQADAIAGHYMRHFNEARDLAELVRLRRQTGARDPALNTLIVSVVERIQKAHREDFGIELAWREPS